MRATFRSLLEAKRRERQEKTGDAGFSLIELIIVIVIIGILVAIALPLFGFIQRTAVDGATQSATKNAATTAVADFAGNNAAGAAADVATIQGKQNAGGAHLTLTLTNANTPADAAGVCVTGSDTGGEKYKAGTEFESGPGC